jgi:hypothetical protein
MNCRHCGGLLCRFGPRGSNGAYTISALDSKSGLETTDGNFGNISSGSGTRIFQHGLELL